MPAVPRRYLEPVALRRASGLASSTAAFGCYVIMLAMLIYVVRMDVDLPQR